MSNTRDLLKRLINKTGDFHEVEVSFSLDEPDKISIEAETLTGSVELEMEATPAIKAAIEDIGAALRRMR
jgi:hypothetical protein